MNTQVAAHKTCLHFSRPIGGLRLREVPLRSLRPLRAHPEAGEPLEPSEGSASPIPDLLPLIGADTVRGSTLAWPSCGPFPTDSCRCAGLAGVPGPSDREQQGRHRRSLLR